MTPEAYAGLVLGFMLGVAVSAVVAIAALLLGMIRGDL